MHSLYLPVHNKPALHLPLLLYSSILFQMDPYEEYLPVHLLQILQQKVPALHHTLYMHQLT